MIARFKKSLPAMFTKKQPELVTREEMVQFVWDITKETRAEADRLLSSAMQSINESVLHFGNVAKTLAKKSDISNAKQSLKEKLVGIRKFQNHLDNFQVYQELLEATIHRVDDNFTKFEKDINAIRTMVEKRPTTALLEAFDKSAMKVKSEIQELFERGERQLQQRIVRIVGLYDEIKKREESLSIMQVDMQNLINEAAYNKARAQHHMTGNEHAS